MLKVFSPLRRSIALTGRSLSSSVDPLTREWDSVGSDEVRARLYSPLCALTWPAYILLQLSSPLRRRISRSPPPPSPPC